MPKVCNHIIHHARTEKEREQVKENLEYFRSIGDTQGIVITIAMLGGCPYDTEEQ